MADEKIYLSLVIPCFNEEAAMLAGLQSIYFMAYGLAKPVMNYFLKNGLLAIRENAALLTGMCLFVCINYIGQRMFVFKSKTSIKGDGNENQNP
jgi:hypothetical protein